MLTRKNERGALIVEATIVFPVMFLVIFLMLLAGNAFLQKCRIENIANEYALKGAAYCADPMLDDVVKNGAVPGLDNVDVQPYRYIFGGMSDIESSIRGEVAKAVRELDTGYFLHMKPTDAKVEVDFNNGFVYSTFSVQIDCRVKIPVRLLGASDYIYLGVATRSDMPVSDTTEFIRNIDLVEDYLERSGLKEKIDGAVEKFRNDFGQAVGKVKEMLGF